MMEKAIRVSALIPCAVLVLGSCALQASTVTSEKIQIPFDFQFQRHRILPAGEYRVEQTMGSEIAVLENIKTGERVQFLRPATTHEEGKARLVFENNASGHRLKSIS